MLSGGTFDNTDGGADDSGQILANGASAEVNIAGYATIIGGTLSTENGGAILVTDGVLDGAQTGDPVNVAEGVTLQTEYLTLEGTIDNAGTIQVEDLSTNEASTLSVDGSATLQGSGNVVLADVAFSNPNGSVSIGMPTLEGSGLDLDQELQGSGQIFVIGTQALTNDSTIDASDAYALSIEGDYPYQLETVSSTVVNLGILESTGTGSLDLNHIIVDNTQDGNVGQIIAGSPGGQSDPQVVLGDVDIEGGTLTTYASSDLIEINGNTILDGTGAPVTISTDSNLEVVSGGSLALDGSIVNEGTITLDGQSLFIGSNGSDANATVTLTGGGTVVLSGSDFPFGYIQDNDTSSGTSLTLDNVDNTIVGAGTIDVDSLINEQSGTIDATGSNGLWLSGPSVTNAGLIESTDGTGELLFYGATVDNQGGQISANGVGTHIDLYNADIIGGTLTTSDGGIIRVFGGDGPNTIDGTTSPATLTQESELEDESGSTLSILGSFINDGTIIDDGDDANPPQPDVVIGNLSGTGAVDIENSSTLEITGSSGIDQAITFENGPTSTGETLQIDATSISASGDFASSIAGLQLGDVINLTNLADETNYSFDGTTLTVSFAGGETASLVLSGLNAQTLFSFSPFGTTGTSITIAGPVVSIAYFEANQATLDQLPDGFTIADTAANVSGAFDALNADTHINVIELTDTGTPALTLSVQQVFNDTSALAKVSSPHTITVVDTPADIGVDDSGNEALSPTQIDQLAQAGVTSVVATGGVLPVDIAQLTEFLADNITVADSAGITLYDNEQNIQNLSSTQISQFETAGVTFIELSDYPIQLTVQQALALTVPAQTFNGNDSWIYDNAGNIEALTPNQITALAGFDVNELAADDVPLQMNVAQVQAIENTNLIYVANLPGTTAVVYDTADNIVGLQAGQIALLPSLGFDTIDAYDAPLQLTAGQIQAIDDNNITLIAPYGVSISDKAADIDTLSAQNISDLPGLGVTAIDVTDNNPVTFNALQAKALAEATSLTPISTSLIVLDKAADIEALSPSDIGTLASTYGATLASTDVALQLSVAQVAALEEGGNTGTASGPGGSDAILFDLAANIGETDGVPGLSVGEIDHLPLVFVGTIEATDAPLYLTEAQFGAINTADVNVIDPDGVYVACYCRGTRILTDHGAVAVENLAINDRVMTKSGQARPIKWIGRRSYTGRFAMGQKHILPVRINAGALDENVPQRDLWISPQHAMYFKDEHLEGVLIEAKDLVNGVSIVQAERVEDVEYFHVELDTHDVILAEGALSETFIDDDSRFMFHNAQEYRALYPDVAAPAQYCALRLEDGFEVEAARRRIALRAGVLSQLRRSLVGEALEL